MAEMRIFIKQRIIIIVFILFQILQSAYCIYNYIRIYNLIHQDYSLHGFSELSSIVAEINGYFYGYRLIYIFFMFIGYMISKNLEKDGVRETIDVYKGNMIIKNRYLLPFCLIIFSFIINQIIIMAMIGKVAALNRVIVVYFFIAGILYFVLPNIVALIAGVIASQQRRIEMSITILAFFAYYFSGKLESNLQALTKDTDLIERLSDCISIYPTGLSVRLPYYMYSIELHVFIRIIAVMLFLVAIVIEYKKRNRIVRIVLILLASICTAYVLSGVASPRVADKYAYFDAIGADQTYYRAIPQEEQPANFNVSEYNIYITADRLLEAEVTITLDKNDLDNYTFTLYHGYKVESIRDNNGTLLEYERNGDYVTVKNNNIELQCIEMKYTGSAPLFYSTSQGIFLPAYFPYYPIPGKIAFFDIEKQGYMKELSYHSYYKLKMDSKVKVVTNLPGKDNKGTKYSYYGEGDGLYILASPFIDTYRYKDQFEIVYSIMQHRESDIEMIADKWAKDPDINIDGKLVIERPYQINYVSSFISDDTIECSLNMRNNDMLRKDD